MRTSASTTPSSPFLVLEKTALSSVILHTDSFGRQYIIKKTNHSRLRREYELLSSLSHPNILKTFDFGYDISEKQFFMLTEYCQKGDMIKFLQHNMRKIATKENVLTGKFEKFWRTIFVAVLNVLLYLKANDLAHLDIKPDNILMNNSYEVKLCDFEFVVPLKTIDGCPQECNFTGGTQIYLSPEILEYKMPYDPVKSEVFSMGVTFINMITGTEVFMNDVLNDPKYKYLKNDKFAEFWGTIKLSKFMSSEIKDLFGKMLKYEARDRIDLEEIRRHPWMLLPILSPVEIANILD